MINFGTFVGRPNYGRLFKEKIDIKFKSPLLVTNKRLNNTSLSP